MDSTLFTKFEAYLLTERRVAKNTFAAYKKDIEQFHQFLIKNAITLESVTARDIKSYLKHMRDLSIGARSVARKISAIKVFFNYLSSRFGWENKAEDITFPKFKKGLPTYLTEEEIEALFAVADQDITELGIRNKIMLYLLYVTGTRISELTSMTLSAVQFDNGFVTVKGKGGKERIIPVPLEMLDLLKSYIQNTHKAFTQKGYNDRSTNYLFPVFYAGVIKPISRQAFWTILNGLWRKTGSKKTISPHQLRHSLATHMLKNGANLRALQRILGHENLATVAIYTHVEVQHLRDIYDKKHPRSQ